MANIKSTRIPLPQFRFSAALLCLILTFLAVPYSHSVSTPSNNCNIVSLIVGQKAKLLALGFEQIPFRPNSDQLRDVNNARLVTYNVLNFVEHKGAYAGQVKLEKHQQEIATVIKELHPDFLWAQEVENAELMQKFSDEMLEGKYVSNLIEGNDSRGIDIGFLIAKDLNIQIHAKTFKGEKWVDPSTQKEARLFSRDLPVYLIYPASDQELKNPPLLVLVGTHFKSKRDRPNDPKSNILRAAQADRAALIINNLREIFGLGNKVPIIMSGDFNTSIEAQGELSALFEKAGLQNAFDLIKPPLPEAERITHTYHPHSGPISKTQMDGFLISNDSGSIIVDTGVYRYKDANGKIKPIPDSYEKRSENPSDHFPVWVDLKLK